MAKIRVAIFDADKGYRERFADYLMSYKGNEMELAVFSSKEFFCEALKVDKFQLVVLGCGYEGVIAQTRVVRVPILVLTEYNQGIVREHMEMEEERISYTGKYQSMDVITKEMQLLAEVNWSKEMPVSGHRNLEVVGVFSPVKHEMQMLFSLLYGKNVAREKKVLYLNLLEFSGFSEIFGDTEYDLGDVIVRLREASVKAETLQACIYEGEAFSYISPFANPENVRELTADDVKELLKAVEIYTDYQIVIVDIGLRINCLVEVLQACSKLYCLGKTGYLFEMQMRQFLTYIERVGDTALLERICHLKLPGPAKVMSSGSNLLEQLDWGELGDFVRMKL